MSLNGETKRKIALVLAVLSLVMLFLPWMTIFVKIDGRNYNMKKLAKNYESYYNGYTIEDQLRDGIMEIQDAGAKMGVNINVNSFVGMYRVIKDSAVSPVELAWMTITFGRFISHANSVSKSIGGYSEDVSGAVAGLWIVGIITWLSIASVVFFAIKIIRGSGDVKKSFVGLLAGAFILSLVFIICTATLNSKAALDDFISAFTIGLGRNRWSEARVSNPLHLTFWVFFFPVLFGAAAFLLDGAKLSKDSVGGGTGKVKKIVENISGVICPALGWACPNCGQRNTAGNAYCSACATPRPEPKPSNHWLCPTCGQQNAADHAFCPKCATPRPVPGPDPKPVPKPVPPAPPPAPVIEPTPGVDTNLGPAKDDDL